MVEPLVFKNKMEALLCRAPGIDMVGEAIAAQVYPEVYLLYMYI